MSEISNVNHVISPTLLKSPTIATSIAVSSTSSASASNTIATINPTLASSASTITRASGTTPTTMLNGHVGTQFNSKSNFEDYSSSNEANYIPIPQFYAGRSVFITGGTGFMGKVLVEKLLRSCPDIKNIYLLIRPKRGQDVSDRLNEMLNAPLFEKLGRENPKELCKVIPIGGDITSEQLGISESDQALLCRTVSIVFHSAATVKFDEKLKLSVTINMLGTKRLVELCHRMMFLEALIHVSTAYCNCDRTDVQEVIYAPPYNPDDIISLINWLPEDMLDQLTPSLIGKRPNTYTFTKALAEHMLLKEAGNLPVAIVRPSIVIASLNEPLAGWIDNFNGPTGLLSALAKGLFRSIVCEQNYVADVVPVDIVINLMIAAAWRKATHKTDNFSIYNCCTGQRHPIKWGEFVNHTLSMVRKHPLESCVWYPSGVLRRSTTLNTIYGIFVHYIPAYLLDALARLMGKKPFVVKIQHKLYKAVECLNYFAVNQWEFKDDNVHALFHTLSPKDRNNFLFDVTNIDWLKYVEQYVLGLRQFLFKQRPESLPASRKRMTRLYYLHLLSKLVVVMCTWRFLMKRSKRLNALWTAFLQYVTKFLRLIPFL
uniref:Fatty acyl-CoA reductase n=1 Tax=Glossina palpalis gambiensis TaxID=67801 RepID=A0A1B0ARC3_9MUSC